MASVAGVVLGVVLLLAGAGKLASPTWPEQARVLGAPRPAAIGVPWLEVVLGALLAVGVARRAVAAVAAGLLGVFTVLLVVRLAQGRRPPCACFGGRTPRPIGPLSVVRNLALVGLAAVVVAGG